MGTLEIRQGKSGQMCRGGLRKALKAYFLGKKGKVLKNRLPNFFDKMLKGLRDKMLGHFKKGLGMKPPTVEKFPF